MPPPSDIWTYNPAQMPADELMATLVGRDELLAELLEHCRQALDSATPPEHPLLYGPRGVGKSTVLRALRCRIAEDEELRRRLIPIAFSEEENGVAGVHPFLARVVQLAGTAEGWPPADYRRLPSAELLAALKAHAGSGRAYLLLPENFGDLLDRVLNHEKPELSELFVGLFADPCFLFVATAIAPLRPPKARKGELFRRIAARFAARELPGLPLLAREVIARRARWDGREALLEDPRVADQIRAVAALSGGNPRYLVELYGGLGREGVADIEESFMRFLNRCTAAQQGLLAQLSGGASATLEALARQRGQSTVKELVDAVATPDETEEEVAKRVRNDMAELLAAGFVVERGRDGRDKIYAVHPPVFQLWYEMRYLDKAHQRLWLLKFFETWHVSGGAAHQHLDSLRQTYGNCRSAHDPARMRDAFGDILFYSHLLPEDDVDEALGDDCRQLLDEGRWQEASEACREARERAMANGEPTRAAGFVLHEAFCLQHGGRFQESLDVLNRVADLVPDLPKAQVPYHLALADTADDLGDTATMRAELELAEAALAGCSDGRARQRLVAGRARLRGHYSLAVGDARKAIGYYEQALAISRETGDRRGEGNHLGNLGNAYADLGDARTAIGYYEQALAISRETGDRCGEGLWLGNLGIAYSDLGDVRKAIGYYEQALAVSRETGDRRGEGLSLGNLGNACRALGDARKAIGYHEQALAIARETGDRRGEGSDLGNLGNAYYDLGDARKAIGHHEQALAIFRETGDRRGEGTALGNLGNACSDLGDARKAIGYYEQALAISRETGDRGGEGLWLGNLARSLASEGDFAAALPHARRALELNAELGVADAECGSRELILTIVLDLISQHRREGHPEEGLALFGTAQEAAAGLDDETVADLLYRRLVARSALTDGPETAAFLLDALARIRLWGRPEVDRQLAPAAAALECPDEENWAARRGALPPGEREAAETVWNLMHADHALHVAKRLLEDGKATEALAQADAFLEEHPDDARGLELALRACVAAGGAADAQQDRIRQATERAPNSASLRLLAASSLAGLGRATEALAHASRATELAPEDASAAALLGRLLRQSGRFPEASTHLARAVELDGDQRKPGYRLELAGACLLVHDQAGAEQALAAFAVDRASGKHRAVYHWLRVAWLLFGGDRPGARAQASQFLAFAASAADACHPNWDFGDLLELAERELSEAGAAMLRDMAQVVRGEQPLAPFALAHAEREGAEQLLNSLANAGEVNLHHLETGLVTALSDIHLHDDRTAAVEAFFQALERGYRRLGETAARAADAVLADAIGNGEQRDQTLALRVAGGHLADMPEPSRQTVTAAMLACAEDATAAQPARELAARLLTIVYYDLPAAEQEHVEGRLRALAASFEPPVLAQFLANL